MSKASAQEENMGLSGEPSKCVYNKEHLCITQHEQSWFLFEEIKFNSHRKCENLNLKSDTTTSLNVPGSIACFSNAISLSLQGITINKRGVSNLCQLSRLRVLRLVDGELSEIPQNIKGLVNLEIVDFSKNEIESIPVGLTQLPRLQTLSLRENKIRNIINEIVELRSLKVFDISSNQLKYVPSQIGEMQELQDFICSNNEIISFRGRLPIFPVHFSKKLMRVDMSNNKLSEIPGEICNLSGLEELNLSGNRIKSVTGEVKKLQSLKTLDLRHNDIKHVDVIFSALPNLENMIIGGQQHVKQPFVDLNQLSRSICKVDMSHCSLQEIPLPVFYLAGLETLIISQNGITEIPENITSCKTIKIFDISHNKLKVLPFIVFELPEILELNASNNAISSFGQLEKKLDSSVRVIDLSSNDLHFFPSLVTNLSALDRVSLRGNHIESLPESVRDMRDCQIDLTDNPIRNPPYEVCCSGLHAIKMFFEDLLTESQNTQCLKTLFLGVYEAGKTSLTQTLLKNKSVLTSVEDRTVGVEICDLNLPTPDGNDVTLSIWDFAGQETYYLTHQFFLTAKSLMLLVVNLHKYRREENFEEFCAFWFKNMVARVKNPIIVPIATHIDKLSREEIVDGCKDIHDRIMKEEEKRMKELKYQRNDIRKLGEDSLSKSDKERLKTLISLLDSKPIIHDKVMPVSSAEGVEGLDNLRMVLLNYSMNKQLFPNVGMKIPKSWADAEQCVQAAGMEHNPPYMSWAEFVSLLNRDVPRLPESRLVVVANYLHNTGKILWYSDIPSLRPHVFLKPQWLVDVFREVIRHDLGKTLVYESGIFHRKIDRALFESMKSDLINTAILHISFLKCIWAPIISCNGDPDRFQNVFDVLIDLMKQFDLGYSLEDPSKLLLPWYLRNEQPGDLNVKHGDISVQYKFPIFIPPGLFARLTVRAHRKKHMLQFKHHWKGGALLRHSVFPVTILLRCSEVASSEGRHSVISLSSRAERRGVNFRFPATDGQWVALCALLRELEDLLKQWPGVRFDRWSVCPQCHEPTIRGEWISGSSTATTVCRKPCNATVSTTHLSPSVGIFSPECSYIYLDNLTSKEGFKELARHMERTSDWEEVAREVGLKDAEIRTIKQDCHQNTTNQVEHMLAKWRERIGLPHRRSDTTYFCLPVSRVQQLCDILQKRGINETKWAFLQPNRDSIRVAGSSTSDL